RTLSSQVTKIAAPAPNGAVQEKPKPGLTREPARPAHALFSGHEDRRALPDGALKGSETRTLLAVRRHLRLLEHDVLAGDRIVLFQLELGRLRPLVLRRVVGEAGAGRGDEANVIAHGRHRVPWWPRPGKQSGG